MGYSLFRGGVEDIHGAADKLHARPGGEDEQLQLRFIAGGQKAQTAEPLERVEPVTCLGIRQILSGLEGEPEVAELVGKAAALAAGDSLETLARSYDDGAGMLYVGLEQRSDGRRRRG